MRHRRMKFRAVGIHQPDATTVRPNEVSRHVCIQAEEGICVLLLGDAGSVLKDDPRNMFVRDARFRCHESGPTLAEDLGPLVYAMDRVAEEQLDYPTPFD